MAPVASTSRSRFNHPVELDDSTPSHTRADSSESERECDEDDFDPVVRRLPVYYTPTYLSSLTLLQYPDLPPQVGTSHPLLPPSLRPTGDDDDEDGHSREKVEARYKPSSQHLEISIPIERHEDRWNDDRARELAGGIVTEADKEKERLGGLAGKGKGKKNAGVRDEEALLAEREERERRRLDRIAYKSTTLPDVTNYLVGVVKDDSLHLSPVTQTFQLRPSLHYLDQLITNERRRKREEKAQADADADSDGEISDTELKKEEAKAVQVSVKQSQDAGSGGGMSGGPYGSRGPANGRAGASLFAPLRQEENEDWVKIKHYHAETPKASKAFRKMFVDDEATRVHLTSVTKPKEYLQG